MKHYTKASTLLRDVKKVLPNTYEIGWNCKRSPYICDTINEICSNPALANRVCYDISRMLDGRFSLPVWLKARGFPECHNHPELVQLHRQQWLDRLILEYKKRGD